MEVLPLINIEYVQSCDLHIFRSPDLRGLFAAHEDLATAYSYVGPQIEILMHENHDIRCTAVPMDSFDDFLSKMKKESSIRALSTKPRPYTLEIVQ